MKKVVSVLAVLAICATIGSTVLANHAQPVAEHGIVPGSDAVTVL